MVGQLPQVQTVYKCNVTAIAISHSTRLVHVILTIFKLWEWGFPARGSNCLLSVLLLKSFKWKWLCREP